MVPVKHIQTIATDTDLLNEYQSTGDQNILARLYLQYTEMVYGVCLKYLKDAEASKDAVMNIYQELLTKLQTHQVTNFKSWLYVVTKNHCLMQLRKEKKMLTVEFQGESMQSEDFSHLDNILEKENNLQKLDTCMEGLNKEQHQAIQLFYLENKCYIEITELTGIEWNKVRSLVQNGRRNLKICMEQHD